MRDEAPAVALPLHRRVRHGMRHPANWLQLVRFAAVGASGYVVNLAVFTAAVHFAGIDYKVAAVLAFLVSVAMVRRGMSVTDFSASGLRDPEILGLGQRISLVSDPALNWRLELPPGRVEIVARDGRRWLREGHEVPGNADNPMDWDGICAKFAECASVCINPPAEAKVARTAEMARRLEDVADAKELIRAIA